MDSKLQQEGNSTDVLEAVKRQIEDAHIMVARLVLAEAGQTPEQSPKELLNRPMRIKSPTCTNNKITSFDSMLILNFVSIIIYIV